jgi:type II secretory pathway component GspD/PulD (secretin)
LNAQINDVLRSKLDQKVTSLEFRDTEIKDVLRLLARQNGLNIVIGSQVQGRISISLWDVTIEDALKTILISQGYHHIIENDIIMVKAFDKEVFGEAKSKIFRLNYIDAVNLVETLTPFITTKGEIQALNLVKTEKVEEKRSDILVVRDLQENLDIIGSIIAELDIAQEQFIIEVRLIETILNEDQKFGFDWPDNVRVSMTGADVTGTGDVDLASGLAAYSGFPVNSKSFKLGILTFDELNFTLDMLAQDEDSKLISNPKVTAINNKKAMIRIGTNIPIPEVSRGIGGDLITYKEKQVDVKLEVIPRMEPDNKINLTVHPSIEEIVGYTGPGDYPQPITSIREVQTSVSVTPEETVVIGGLVKDNKSTISKKVWLLGYIPLLGELFTNRTEEVKKTDLLIFITPKLLKVKS